MPKFVVSTVGTSLLTRHAQKDEREALTRCSNYVEGECPDEISALIEKLHFKALEQLESRRIEEIRQASAELNGLIGLNGGLLPSGNRDIHILIATDTAQGRATAETVKEFLQRCGCSVHIVTPKNLSTKDETHFSEGVKDLLSWCDETLEGYRQAGYEIVFNLTGGFKSLQGYMNTIGMFYADRMIYIFESPESELIEIPRLPIQLDRTVFETHLSDFLLLYSGNKEFPVSAFPDVPEALIEVFDNTVIPSLWGSLVWNKAKEQLLSGELVSLPRLHYDESFTHDFHATKRKSDRVKLQETLARVAVLLERENGSTRLLKHHTGLQYEDLVNTYVKRKPVGHFRVTQGRRVSCIAEEGGLTLRHFGEHDYVNNHP
jgi:putative CRISPR-associated protein (TIGR02619 family)